MSTFPSEFLRPAERTRVGRSPHPGLRLVFQGLKDLVTVGGREVESIVGSRAHRTTELGERTGTLPSPTLGEETCDPLLLRVPLSAPPVGMCRHRPVS